MPLDVLSAMSVLAWLRTWPCRGSWQDHCWAWKHPGPNTAALTFVAAGSRSDSRLSDGQPWGTELPLFPTGKGHEPGQGPRSWWSPQLRAKSRSSVLRLPSPSCRPAELLIAGLAWSVLGTAAATGTFQGKGGVLGLGQSWEGLGREQAGSREDTTREGPSRGGSMSWLWAS